MITPVIAANSPVMPADQWIQLPQERVINEICKPLQFKHTIRQSLGSGCEFAELQNCTLSSSMPGPLHNLSELTGQVLDFALSIYRQQGSDRDAYISSISDFMKLRGLNDRRTARSQIHAFIECMYHLTICRKGQNGIESEFRVISEKTKLNSHGDMAIYFTPRFKALLKTAVPMPYHTSILKINTKQRPGAYSVARKMLERLHICRASEECLSVQSLLRCMGIDPNHKTIRSNFKARVRSRLESTLNSLKDVVSWKYCHYKRFPLSKPINEIGNLEFLTLYVVFKSKNPNASSKKTKDVLLTSEPPAVDGARVSC